MKHRSSDMADALSIDVEAYRDKYYNGAHVAIIEYQLQLAMIEALSWTEHTSDWDLFVVVELTDGQILEAPYGYAELEWAKKLDCLKMMDDIKKVQSQVTMVVPKESVEDRISSILSPEEDKDFRRVVLNIDEISKIGLNY